MLPGVMFCYCYGYIFETIELLKRVSVSFCHDTGQTGRELILSSSLNESLVSCNFYWLNRRNDKAFDSILLSSEMRW